MSRHNCRTLRAGFEDAPAGARSDNQAHNSVIENVYKKVNGTLDGLEDKIGPGFNAASTSPSPTPSP